MVFSLVMVIIAQQISKASTDEPDHKIALNLDRSTCRTLTSYRQRIFVKYYQEKRKGEIIHIVC